MVKLAAVLLAATLGVPVVAEDPSQESELVLVPIFLNTRGANHSRWSSELTTYNPTAQWIPTEDGGALPCHWIIDPPPCGQIPPDADVYTPSAPEMNMRGGFLLRIPSQVAGDLVFSLRVLEESGATGDMGLDVPVVRERDLRTGTFQLPSLPLTRATGELHGGFREMLRVYAIGDGSSARARVNVRSHRDGKLVRSFEIELTPSGSRLPHLYAEETAVFSELKWTFEALEYARVVNVRVEIEPLTEGFRWWALATVTNNRTQQVSVVTAR